jgi:hypothetical protein
LAGIRSSKLLEILLPNLLINLEGISQEDVFAAIDATTGDCDVTKLQGWRNRIDPEARSAATAFLDAICAGHDSEVLAATVPDILCALGNGLAAVICAGFVLTLFLPVRWSRERFFATRGYTVTTDQFSERTTTSIL